MSLKERVYSILVVSAAEHFNAALSELLPESNYSPVRIVSSISAAKRCLSEKAFDFVIVNSPLPDDIGTHFAIDTSTVAGAVVLLLVRSDIYTSMFDKVGEYGVFTLSKPTSKAVITHALEWMASARERQRYSEKKTLSLEEKMVEIRIVNRAKLLLISEMHLDESEAHRYIEKQAMDRCVTRRVIAEDIIKTYS